MNPQTRFRKYSTQLIKDHKHSSKFEELVNIAAPDRLWTKVIPFSGHKPESIDQDELDKTQWQYVIKYLHAYEHEQLPNNIDDYPPIKSKIECLELVLG